MSLVQLIYASRANKTLTGKDINEFLEKARTKNPKLSISGVLISDAMFFLQYLEGPARNVNELYHTITNDQRHENIHLVSYKNIEKRNFANWEMGFIMPTEEVKSVFFRYGLQYVFDPYILTSTNVCDFIQDICEVHLTMKPESFRAKD